MVSTNMADRDRAHFSFLLALRQRIRNRKRNRKRKHEYWVRPIFCERKAKGEFHQLVLEMKLCDTELFFKYFRMLPNRFEELLRIVSPLLVKNCRNREPVSPEQRLSVTLRHLVTGDSHTTIGMSYRLSPTTVGRIIQETCEAIWTVLMEQKYLKAPSTEQEWKEIAIGFEMKWNFPNCIGAIDGKHVVIQAPPRAGSTFYNYKGTHSIVLMAVVSSDYKFTMVDIGEAGCQSDGGVFAHSQIGYAMNNGKMNLPSPRQLSNQSPVQFPYVLVGDEAFPLKVNLIKPYPRGCIGINERVANYRISRARRVVENSFGICASRFRIFRRSIIAKTTLVIAITKAVVLLHNFLMYSDDEGRDRYVPSGCVDEEVARGMGLWSWRDEGDSCGLRDTSLIGSTNYSREAKIVRDTFRDYFISEQGSLPWQFDMITSTLCSFDE